MRRPHVVNASGVTPANPSLTLPVTAAFYYPWYPGGWDQLGYTPFTRYTPTLGSYYDGEDPTIIDTHMRQMKAAGLDAAICSWWGAGVASGTPELHTAFDADGHFPALLDSALQRGMKIALYYENEGPEFVGGHPSAAQIEADLDYLQPWTSHPAWLHVDGRPVIFVYSGSDTSAGNLTTRWSDATQGYTTHYVSLKTFSGATSEPDQPDSWHQYAPATNVNRVTGMSYNIAPGFWRIDEANPRLARSTSRWTTDVANMLASGDDWLLVTSWNEWGEGTQIEPTSELGSSELDILAAALA